MEKRKLQRTGGASLTMTLPKRWTAQHALRHQSVVFAYMQKTGALLIKPQPLEPGTWHVTVNIDSLSLTALTRETIGLYIAGVDEIILQGERILRQQRMHIRSLAQGLVGFEIVDESGSKIVLKNIFDVRKFPLSATIAKMFLITASMVEDALRTTARRDQHLAQDLADRDHEIDKMLLVLRRQFSSLLHDKVVEEELNIDRINLHYYQNIAVQLERIADHAVKITAVRQQAVLAMPRPKIFTALSSLLVESAAMVQHVDREHAHRILDTNAALEKTLQQLRARLKKTSPAEVILTDSLDRLRGYLMNIAELTIDQAMNQHVQTIVFK